MARPSQSELADALGLDPALVTRYKRRGMPVHSIEAAQAWRASNVRARVGGRPGKGTGASDARSESQQPAGTPVGAGYNEHRARREKAEADRAELLALRERGQVLLREPAERAVFDAFRGLRDTVFRALRDAAPKVRGLVETQEIALILEQELRQAIAGFELSMAKRIDELAGNRPPE